MKAEDIGLKEHQLKEINDILSSNSKITEAVVYGSRAKGTYKPFSDIDLTLKGDDLSFRDLGRLDDLFYYSYLPYIIDLSIYRKLSNPDLMEHIDRVGITIYKAAK